MMKSLTAMICAPRICWRILSGQPIATLRLRWFAGFGKDRARQRAEKEHRSSGVVKVMLAAACDVAARRAFGG